MPNTVSKGVNTADKVPVFAQLMPGGEKTMSSEMLCDDHLPKGASGFAQGQAAPRRKTVAVYICN